MIMVQQGNPNIYSAMPPKEALANLKQQLINSLDEKIKKIDILVEQLSPIYDSAEKPEELELAYIIKGQENIVRKMRGLIRTARKEITAFISHPSVLKEIRDSLTEAQEKGKVRLNIGVTSEVMRTEGFPELGEVRLLCCNLGMIISDMKTLLTFTNWTSEAAVMTQDRSLIRVCRDYYDNPACCRKVNSMGTIKSAKKTR
jgi:sugar-specific transcriptional regulator TrmB